MRSKNCCSGSLAVFVFNNNSVFTLLCGRTGRIRSAILGRTLNIPVKDLNLMRAAGSHELMLITLITSDDVGGKQVRWGRREGRGESECQG